MGPSAYRSVDYRLNSRHQIGPLMVTAQSSLCIEDGPVFSVDMLNVSDENTTIVYMVAHHLVVDIVSWRNILRDLNHLLETGALPTEPPVSFRSWLDVQSSSNETVDVDSLLPFKELPSNVCYWSASKPPTYGNTVTEAFDFDENITMQALVDCHRTFRSEPMDLFLAALAYAFARTFTDRDIPTLHIESHGREPPANSTIDISGTVGWFTTICPLVAPVSTEDVLDIVRRIKDIRNTIPANGRPYFARKYLSGAEMPSPMEVLFNYLGGGVGGGGKHQGDSESPLREIQLDESIVGPDPMAIADVGPETKRLAMFEISAVVVNNKLQFSFIYDATLTRTGDVRKWIGACKATLEIMVCGLMQRAAEPTLSDYPLLPLTYEDLSTLTKVTLPRAGIVQPLASVEDIYPCTPVQEGMLISQLRNPNAYIFHAIYNVKHTSPDVVLDTERLGRAWRKLVDRHASLRTVFIESVHCESVFDQVALKNVDCGMILLKSSDEEAETMLDQVTMTNRTGLPLLPHQVTICATDSGKVLMKLEVNHVAVDGGSLSIIIQELAATYNGNLDLSSAPLFSDYVRFIRSQPANMDTRYWMRYLQGLEPCYFPRLSVDNTPDMNTRCLRATTLQFSRFDELRRLSEKTQVTLANIMHAAWAFVLRQYTGSDDVCFGYLTADRDAPVENIRNTVGTLINMLCCRIQFSTSQTLEDIFRNTQEQHLESTQYQRCSLANVQHALGMGGRALYNTSISTQNHSKDEEDEAGEDTIVFEMQTGHDPSEVRFMCHLERSALWLLT